MDDSSRTQLLAPLVGPLIQLGLQLVGYENRTLGLILLSSCVPLLVWVAWPFTSTPSKSRPSQLKVLDPDETRPFIPESITEILSRIAGVRPLQRQVLRETYLGKWVRWEGTIASITHEPYDDILRYLLLLPIPMLGL